LTQVQIVRGQRDDLPGAGRQQQIQNRGAFRLAVGAQQPFFFFFFAFRLTHFHTQQGICGIKKITKRKIKKKTLAQTNKTRLC
jgi:hypothetical protein